MATTEPNARFEGKVEIAVERSVAQRDEVETPQRLRLHRGPYSRSKSRYKNTDTGASL